MQLFKVFVLIFLIRNSHPPTIHFQNNTQKTYFDSNIYYYQIIKLEQVHSQITKYIILTDQEDFFIEKVNGIHESICHLSYLQEEDKQHCSFKPNNDHFLENQINLKMLFDQINCVKVVHSDYLNNSVPTPHSKQELIHNYFTLNQDNRLYNMMATTTASLLATSALTAFIGKIGLSLGLIASIFMIKRQMQPIEEDFTFMIEFAEENYQRRICQGINPKISMTNLPQNYQYYYLLAFTQETREIEYISWFIQDSQEFIINSNSDQNYIGPKRSGLLYQIRLYFFNKKLNIVDPYIFIAKLNNKEIIPLSQFTWNK